MALIYLYVFSVYLISNNAFFKVFSSIGLGSMLSAVMFFCWTINGLLKGGMLVLKRHPGQAILAGMFVSAFLSVLISKIDPSKAVPLEVFSYDWVKGLNAPELRGWVFLARFFLAVFSIQFLISWVKTPDRFLKVSRLIIFLHSVLCVYLTAQIILKVFFHIDIGYTFPLVGGFGFRIGGYVGEPGTLSVLLVCGYFLVFSALRHAVPNLGYKRWFLFFIFALSNVCLFFTFSTAFIIGVYGSLMVCLNTKNHRKKLLVFLFMMLIFGGLFVDLIQQVIIGKVRGEVFSLGYRSVTWIAGLKMLLENPLFGVGLGQAPFLMGAYAPSAIIAELLLGYKTVRVPPMNMYIEWAAETGLIGLALLVGLMVRIYLAARAAGREGVDILRFSNTAYGGALFAYLIGFNAGPGNMYIGMFHLTLAMCIAGLNIFRESQTQG